jgi:DNA repair photolyase
MTGDDGSRPADPFAHRGRGARLNTVNRYTQLEVELDPEEVTEGDLRLRTRYLDDTSRSAVASNSSPDVGFDFSVNPYRGCEHGCSYCLSGDTLILMADGSSKPLADVEVGDAILGTARRGHYRRLVPTVVRDKWTTFKPAFAVKLRDGTEIVASADHLFLTERGWKHVASPDGERRPTLTTANNLVGWGEHGAAVEPDDDYAIGYLSGVVRGDGPLGHYTNERTAGGGGTALRSSADLRVAVVERLNDGQVLYDITTGTGDFIANGVVAHNCYARPTHEFLGLSAGLDFERVILVKRDAPRLVEERLRSPSWQPTVLAMSGVTDPYQPVERRLGITRAVLQVLARYRNPVGIITKNALVTRDIDVLAEMAAWNGVNVFLSVTTLDETLRSRLEPRTSTAANRLRAVRELADAGIPVGVNVAPIIPGLTDHEVPDILAAAAEAGATYAGYTVLRLPGPVADIFTEWLESNYPLRKEKVLNRVREAHDGSLSDAAFFRRMRGHGAMAEQVRELFHLVASRLGLERERYPALDTSHFRRPGDSEQPSLFGP